ncbi:MAG: aminoacyl-tRNA hydrolase [Planctomycetes bacterium]|nr:aminoacyl-tRNA hydrolase [Planctomycetota bacterium]
MIPWSELRFEQDLGGGPGGQHVNRTASRVTLIWIPAASEAFSDFERRRLTEELAHRITQAGELRIRSASERSAHRNREECLSLLATLLAHALAPRRRRVATRPTRASKKRRREDKQRRSDVKRGRRRPRPDD